MVGFSTYSLGWGAIMDIKTALRGIESKESSEVGRDQAERGDVQTSAEELAALLSDAPIREIEAGNRIQRDIAEYRY
jgi:hypothetical protein